VVVTLTWRQIASLIMADKRSTKKQSTANKIEERCGTLRNRKGVSGALADALASGSGQIEMRRSMRRRSKRRRSRRGRRRSVSGTEEGEDE